jgi:L-asparaginase
MSAVAGRRPTVVVIATGGTIAMRHDPVRGGAVPALSGEDLLARAPAVSDVAAIEIQNLCNIPSDYMDPPRWIALSHAVNVALARPGVAGAVVSHGTDTIEETAWWLDLTVDSDKPVVLTGAQRNASEADSDGPRNLLHAVRVAADMRSHGHGTVVVMNAQIHAARAVTKLHTSNLDGFGSGESGLLGAVDAERMLWWRAPLRRRRVAIRAREMPYVEIVAMYGGADGAMIRAALERGARGLVVQGLGAGNVNAAMYSAIRDAISHGVAVVIATRVPDGGVAPHYGWDGGGATLVAAGAVMGDRLSPQKARILLMLLLQDGVAGQQDLQSAFDR